MLATPDIILAGAITLLAILITTAFAIAVSRARRRFNAPPPAITGPAELERVIRVHGNTVEAMILFVPALWLATLYFRGWLPALIGLIWCLGRIGYGLGYRASTQGRLPGFIISQLALLVLVILAGWGLITAWSVA